MAILRYMGPTPNSDNSVVNRKSVQDYIASNTPSLTPARLQASQRGATYPLQSEVTSRFVPYVSSTQLNTEGGKYFNSSDIGSSIASLSNSQIPASQRPTSYQQFLEPSGAVNNVGVMEAQVYTYPVTLRSTTVSRPTPYMPLVSGYTEVRTVDGAVVGFRVVDSLWRVVAEGYSKIGLTGQATLGQVSAPVYTGSETFSLQAILLAGSTSVNTRVTGWSGEVIITPVPA